MLFAIAGYLKPGAEGHLIEYRADFNELLAGFPKLVAVGVLRGADGLRKGYLGFVDASDQPEAEQFLRESPFYEEGLYERVEVFRYDLEVGQIS